jgi:hypothetical protein
MANEDDTVTWALVSMTKHSMGRGGRVLFQPLLWLLMNNAMASGEWQGVLDAYRSPSGLVNYGAIQEVSGLDTYLQALGQASEPEDRSDRIAFWVNAYNALTVDLVADHFPIESIRDIDNGDVWRTRRFMVAGKTRSLDEIEHKILRPLGEPRIHFALNCAALGCPTLPGVLFDGSKLELQLEAATRTWVPVHGLRIDRQGKRLYLSKIFEWYAADFLASDDATIPSVDKRFQGVLQFLVRYVEESDANWIRSGEYQIVFSAYDWKLNGLPR